MRGGDTKEREEEEDRERMGERERREKREMSSEFYGILGRILLSQLLF